MNKSALFIFVLFTISGYSQSTINSYKYVIVPERFSFSKEDNQYGLSETVKTILENKGFVVYMANESLPPILVANKCGALRAELVDRKRLFVTNLTLLLKDCQGDTVFKSKEGKSREKEWVTAYNEALADASSSLNGLAYKYDSTLSPIATSAALATSATATTPTTSAPATSTTPTTSGSPTSPASSTSPAGSATPSLDFTGTLYAQAIANGYQLVDSIPKKVLILLKTSTPDYFIAETGYSNGIVFKKDGTWFFEYYKDDKLVSKPLQIKF